MNLKNICSFVVLVFGVCLFFGCAAKRGTPVVKEEIAPIQEEAPTRFYSKKKTADVPIEYETTKDYEYKLDGTYGTLTPICDERDYIIKGIIFLESKVTIDVNGERNGSEITNYMLMKEAEKLGGDDVINIKIDEREESKVIDSYDKDANFLGRKYKKTSYIYHATALAIKYLGVHEETNSSTEKKQKTVVSPKKEKVVKQEETKNTEQPKEEIEQPKVKTKQLKK